MPSRPPSPQRPRVVVLRGHQANPWELRPWELLGDRYDVRYLRSDRPWFATDGIGLAATPARTLRGVLPRGRVGDLAVRAPGDRYLDLARHLRGADVVHAQELGYWYTAQAAGLRARLGFRLALTVWETLPFADAYRNVRTRRYRRRALATADVFLPTTERAAEALRLEGAPEQRIQVSPPGIDTARFAPSGRPPDGPPLVLSPGRLVWEKGHQDVLRAFALARSRGALPPGARVLVVGSGPERARLERHAADLGVADAVEVRAVVPYDAMPALYASAACMVLASLPTWGWEEQFGMVLVEALASGVPVVASTSGAIPEVAGPTAAYVAPGDWVGLADVLAERLRDPAPHVVRDAERVRRLSTAAAADRLAAAYGRLLAD